MKKVFLLLLILPFFFACKDDASSSSEPETKPKPIVPAMCGDFHLDVDIGEECDDGNLDNGDGCSSSCKLEPSIAGCSMDAQCDSGKICQNGNCVVKTSNVSACGDGKVDLDIYEQCDRTSFADNLHNYYGCTADCKFSGYCGDGIIQRQFGEECDGDPNCSSACKVIN